MAKKVEAEIEEWMENIDDEYTEAFLEMIEVEGNSVSMTIGEEEHAFSIEFTKDYPNGKLSVTTEDDELFQWQQTLTEYLERAPKVTISKLLSEAAESYLKGSREDGDDMEGIDLRQSHGGFDVVVSGALAKETKKKITKLADVAKQNKRVVAFVEYDESYSIIRSAVSVEHLDEATATAWGVNRNLPIIVEFKFFLEDERKAPHFSMFQTEDPDIGAPKMKNVHSFGLEWQLRARLSDWLNGLKHESKPNWPPKENEDWIGRALDHILERVDTCTKTCIICDGPLPFQMIKPAVCDNMLCVHSHEQYGLGADVASELRDSPDVVDLLISFCYAIAQGDGKRFNPYPVGVEAKLVEDQDGKRVDVTKHFMDVKNEKAKNLSSVKQVLEQLPSVTELAKFKDSKSLQNTLDLVNPLAFPLLRWIITSNRAHLAKLSKDEMIKEAVTEHQYMFLSSPPEKEGKFQELKAKKGSFWAFHGSSFANWHSILRIGLKNYSNTEFMSTGAAYGAGIYLSPQSATSAGYSPGQEGWKQSKFHGNGALVCLSICEVIDDGYVAKPHYVIPNEDHVMTRYFLIYNNQYRCPSLDAKSLHLKGTPISARPAAADQKKSSGGILKKLLQ